MNPSPTLASIQAAAQNNRIDEAQSMLRSFISGLFPLSIERVEVRRDTLSLNSVNGFIHLSHADSKTGDKTLFFKFHHEENEEGLKEYYNSQLLSENGFPVEMPVYASHEVGRQIVIYPFKASERMADICKRLDFAGEETVEFKSVLAAQVKLDRICLERYLATLHEAPVEKIADEPILQLFHQRLTDDPAYGAKNLGGRFQEFYANRIFELPENSIIRYEDLASLAWRVNGVEYDGTLKEAFTDALNRLRPASLALPGTKTCPAVVAHGDAHNGNVWYNEGTPATLSLFDPAFAGPHVPVLLAEIKPLFHNIFAHPLWLYDSQEANAKLNISFAIENGCIEVEHDWQVSPLRQRFLEIKRDQLFKPLLKELRQKKLLPDTWQDTMRSALFCCPTLVMNLRAHAGNANNAHTPKTSLLGLATAIMMAYKPVSGSDILSDFFDELQG